MRFRPVATARRLAASVALVRLAGVARTRRAVAPTDQPSPGSIAVVVPARDEAHRVGPLLAALRGASGVTELIVVDDESSDATAAVAAQAGARVVAGRPLPPGWVGKPWALQQGLAVATAEWIVVLDADTRPDPRLPAAVVARAVADGTDLLTVAGRFDCPTPGSRWLHPAMLTSLVYRFGAPGRRRRPASRRIIANGQCMVTRREPLCAAGGFGLVAGALVDDVALARRLAAAGRSVDFLDASDLLTVRMYESFGETWRGWGRSLGLPGVEPRWRHYAELFVLVVALPLPLLRVALRRNDLVDVALLTLRLGTLIGTGRAYVRRGPAYWLSPLADPLAVAAVARSGLRSSVTWRRRRVSIRPA